MPFNQNETVSSISTIPVCIVGAGPAGMSCSFYLEKLGIPHVLVESKRFPRDKVCGEAYDGRVHRILNEISPDFLQEMEEKGIIEKSWSYSLHFKSASIPVYFSKEDLPRIQTIRKEFDAFLIEKLKGNKHCTLLEDHTFQNYTETEHGVQVHLDKALLNAQLLILANGGQADKPKPNEKVTFFLRQYFENMPIEDRQTQIFYIAKPEPLVVCFNPVSRGQCNVQIGVSKRFLTSQESSLNALFEKIKQSPQFKERFDAATALGKPKGTFMRVQNSIPEFKSSRVLSIGAALLTVNTASGLGLGNALTIGKLTALHAENCLKKQSFSAAEHRKLHSEIQSRLKNVLRMNRLLNFIQLNIALVEPLVYLGIRIPLLKKILHDPELVKNLNKPHFYWKLLFRRTDLSKTTPSVS